MEGNVVTAVHQVVAHHVDEINTVENLGTGILVEGDHVLPTTGHGNGQSLVADGCADGGEELGICLDLVDFVLVRNLLVVLSVATGVFPVDVCIVRKIASRSFAGYSLTNTVKSIIIEHGSNVLSKSLARGVVLRTIREARGISPSTDSNHELRVRPKALAHSVNRLEWLVRWRGIRVEQLRSRKAHHGMVDTLGLIRAGEIGRVPSAQY